MPIRTDTIALEYNRQWKELDDFILFNPGARHRRRWILRELDRIPFFKLLDAGCGNGELLIAIKRHMPSAKGMSGVDISSHVIEQNKIRLPEVNFQVLDLENQSLEETFDVIVCSEVIEHLENRRIAFRNLSSMLVPTGTLLLTSPTGHIYTTEKHFGHITHPNLQEIAELAIENGFRIMKTRNWGFPFYNFTKWATNLNSDWAIKNFASGRYSLSSKIVSHLCYFGNFLNLPSSAQGCQLFIRLQKL